MRSKAQQIIDAFHNINGQLNSIVDQAKNELQNSVEEANTIVEKIADLNKQILANYSVNGQNNTLLDQRDALINQLSDLIDITTVFHSNGTVSLYNSYQAIADEGQAYTIELNWQSEQDVVQASISLSGNENTQVKSGKIKSLIDTVNNQTSQLTTQLDQLVAAFVQRVNQVHRSNYSLDGTTGIDFFDSIGLTSSSIQLSKMVSDSLSNIAVSMNGQSGDGSGALDIANIKDANILGGNQVTTASFYSSILSQLGENSKSAQQNLNIQTDMVNMLENQRQSIMGVSLEEEMVNMIKYQQAFGAASKIITSVDEMMQTIIDMVG